MSFVIQFSISLVSFSLGAKVMHVEYIIGLLSFYQTLFSLHTIYFDCLTLCLCPTFWTIPDQ